MKKLKVLIIRPLQNKNGNVYIELLVAVFVLLLCIALAVNVVPIFEKKQNLEHFAKEMMRSAETTGTTEISNRIELLKAETKLNPIINWAGTEYIAGTKRIALNDIISLELYTEYDIGFFTFGSFPINIYARATGQSEVYFK